MKLYKALGWLVWNQSAVRDIILINCVMLLIYHIFSYVRSVGTKRFYEPGKEEEKKEQLSGNDI